MIKFMVEKNCCEYEATEQVLSQCRPFILEVVNDYEIDTLSFFVVSGASSELYYDTVQKYSKLLQIEREVTNDESFIGAGITIEGLTKQGEYQQVIIIKSGILVGLLMDLCIVNKLDFKEPDDYKEMKYLAIKLVTHELGHAIDNQKMFNLTKRVGTECKFNVNSDEGYNQYIKFLVTSILGEYYAEIGMYQILKNYEINMEKDDMLEECIRNYSLGNTKNQVLERVYRILYLYMHRLAYCHMIANVNSFDDTFNYCEDVLEYRQLLEIIELEVLQLSGRYPNWNMEEDLDSLYNKVNDMINYEAKKHIN